MVEIELIDLPSPSSSPESSNEQYTKNVGKINEKGTSTNKALRKSGKPYQFVPSACRICLGKATGHHYDVASCNGCKSFFRRVTIEKLQYKCAEHHQCFENLQAGDPLPKCRACRYKKCVEKGMNPLGIQSELRKHSEKASGSEGVMDDSNIKKELVVLPRIIEPPKSIEAQVTDLIQHLMRIDLKTKAFRDCKYNPATLPPLKEVVKDEISIIGLADRLGPMPGWPLSQQEIDDFRKPSSVPGTPRPYVPNIKRWFMYDLLTIIEMAKTFDFFGKLSEIDRFYLCRDTALMVSNLTKAYVCFENKTDVIVRPDGQKLPPIPTWLPIDIHDRLSKDIGKRAIASLFRMKLHKTEFLLLRAILVCNDAAPDISSTARSILSLERSKYTMALFHFVMANSGMEGPGRFGHILNVIDVLERQQKDQRDVNVYIALYRPRWVKIPLLDDIMLTC